MENIYLLYFELFLFHEDLYIWKGKGEETDNKEVFIIRVIVLIHREDMEILHKGKEWLLLIHII